MGKQVDTRTRLVETTARLLRTQGFYGTGLNQIIAESSTPRGSLYFHFPGGKEELTVEALRQSGVRMTELLRSTFDAHPDPGEALRAYVHAAARAMEKSGWRRGCPIATV